jgi:hypothetical protein
MLAGEFAMLRKSWPLLALLGLLFHTGLGWSQTPEPAPAPRPAAYILPPIDRLPAIEPIVDPILADSPVGSPGFFTNLDLFFLRPHFSSHLIGSPDHGLSTVTLTTEGSLGNTLAPRFELGYRLAEQLGEFHLGYWFEIAEQSRVPTDSLGGVSQKDRLNLNVVDLDWGNRLPFALGPGWDIRFNVGIRIAAFYFDTRRDFGALGSSAGALEQRASDHFVGVGPEAGVDLSRELLVPGLALVGRASGADLFGNIRQSFSQTTTGADPLFASDTFRHQVSVPMLTLEIGLSYSPPGWNYSRFLAGYVWQEMWQIGRLNDSNGDLLNRGFFLRAEFNF